MLNMHEYINYDAEHRTYRILQNSIGIVVQELSLIFMSTSALFSE